MTERHEQDEGGIATLEPAASGGASPDGLAQSPLEPNGTDSPAGRRGAADRKAARELKRAERAERRPDRNERKLTAAIAAPPEPAADSDVAAVAFAESTSAEPLAQEAMPEPELEVEPTAAPESGFEPADALESIAPDVDAASATEASTPAAPQETATTRRERGSRRPDRLERKAARRGDGQDGAEPAPTREERRADRAERRASRPAKAAAIAPTGAGAPAASPEGVADGDAPRPPTLVKADIGAVPGPDGKAKRTDRKAGRADVQHAAAAEALSAIDPNNAAIAPLIRYVNAVSMHLNESQKMIGKLQIERDALRAQVVSLDAEPIDASRFAEIAMPADAADSAELKQQRRSERQAARTATGETPETEADENDAPSMDDTGRKRRLIAIGALAFIGLVALATRVMNHPVDLSNVSKGSLGGLAVVGQFMQVFLAGMIFYRLARIGGRAGRWLFPENDPKLAKKQQQEAKLKQKKNRHAEA